MLGGDKFHFLCTSLSKKIPFLPSNDVSLSLSSACVGSYSFTLPSSSLSPGSSLLPKLSSVSSLFATWSTKEKGESREAAFLFLVFGVKAVFLLVGFGVRMEFVFFVFFVLFAIVVFGLLIWWEELFKLLLYFVSMLSVLVSALVLTLVL
jgi:hypothetical protein